MISPQAQIIQKGAFEITAAICDTVAGLTMGVAVHPPGLVFLFLERLVKKVAEGTRTSDGQTDRGRQHTPQRGLTSPDQPGPEEAADSGPPISRLQG